MKLKLLNEGFTTNAWADVLIKDRKLTAIKDGIRKCEGKYYDAGNTAKDYKFEIPNYKIQPPAEKKFFAQVYGPADDDWSVDLQELKISSLKGIKAIHLTLGDTLVAVCIPGERVQFLQESLLVDSEELRYSPPRVTVWFDDQSPAVDMEFLTVTHKSKEDETREIQILGEGDSPQTLIIDGGEAVLAQSREPVIEYVDSV